MSKEPERLWSQVVSHSPMVKVQTYVMTVLSLISCLWPLGRIFVDDWPGLGASSVSLGNS